MSARTATALRILAAHPNITPAGFAAEFWARDFRGPSGHTLHAQRNKVNAPMASWWAAGYLGRLRKLGYISGGYWDRREPRDWHLTEKGRALLK